jgi:uncharacterized membrane protein
MQPETTETAPSGHADARAFWTSNRVARAVRSGALLAAVGASIALFVEEAIMSAGKLDAFLSSNDLPLVARNRLLLVVLASASLSALSVWGVILRRRTESALDRVERLAQIVSPLGLLGLVLPLFKSRLWVNDPLLLGCAIAIVVLVFEQAVARAMRSIPDGWTRLSNLGERIAAAGGRLLRSAPLVLVTAGALGYGVFVTILTMRYHDRLGTSAFDLGGYDNIFYNALHGHPLRGTVAVPSGENWSSLRVHAEFSTYAFLPFYALRPRAETLLCMQAFVVGLGAVPIYLVASRRIPCASALLLAAAYLLFAPIHSGNFYDFHFQPLASTLLLWCFYFVERKKNVAFAVVFVVALGCREDVSLSFVAAGVLMLASGYRPLMGFVVALVSGVYFVAVRFAVMPHFGVWWFQDMYKGLTPSGDSTLFGVVKTIVSNPLYTFGTMLTREKVLHVLQIFLPLAFLPLRRPGLWFGFVPAILATILTTGYHPTTDTTFQYVFYWVPFIFVGTALVLEQIAAKHGLPRHIAAVLAMTLATVLTSLHWGVIFQRQTFASAWGHINLDPLSVAERQTLSDLLELGSTVPTSASLALSENENPHFSNRLTVYALRLGVDKADYVLYRTDSGGAGANQASEALAHGQYARVGSRGKFALLKRVDPP